MKTLPLAALVAVTRLSGLSPAAFAASPVVVVGTVPEVSPLAVEAETRPVIEAGSVWKYRGLIDPVRFQVVAVGFAGSVSVRPVGTTEAPTRWTEDDFRRHFRPVAFDPHG